MAESGTKLDPTAEKQAATEPTLAKDETEKLTTGVTEDKPKAGETASSASESKPKTFADLASSATASAKDNVFGMFGGGPKKEKKEKKEDEDADEPSGSSKKKAEDVSTYLWRHTFGMPRGILALSTNPNAQTRPRHICRVLAHTVVSIG